MKESFLTQSDTNGQPWLPALIQSAKTGDGFQLSHWQNRDGDLVPRLSKAVWLENWNIKLGTSLDLGDMEAAIAELQDFSSRQVSTSIGISLAAMAIIAIVVITLGLLLPRSFIRPLGVICKSVEEIAAGGGDLTRRIRVYGNDELADLANKFNTFLQAL